MPVPPMRLRLVAPVLCLLLVSAGCSWERPEDAVLVKPTAASAEPPGESASPPRASHDGKSVAARLEDATLMAQVTRALMDERSLRPFAFDPIANSGRVTLHGDVNTRAEYDRAARVARDVKGVRAVANEITVNGKAIAEAPPATKLTPAPPAALGTQTAARGAAAHHTVRSGESLWTIAQRSGTTPDAIKRLNDLSSSTLKPGQRLLVPRSAAPATASSGSEADSEAPGSSSAAYHTVQSGESLWTIARRNGLTIDRLKRLNGLRSNTVKPGQRLRVN